MFCKLFRFDNANPGSSRRQPYGGTSIVSAAGGGTSTLSPTPPPTGSVICPTPSGSTPACVLTGQYNRNRSGANVYEPVLADTANITKYFTNTQYYQTDPTDYYDSTHTFNPIMAQPLWVSNVPHGTGTKNVLLAATLNTSVYAFDADAGTILWKDSVSTNLARKNCGSTGVPVIPVNGHPGVTPLAYYGIVSTPVIDLANTDPVAFVVSGCTTTAAGPTGLKWYVNAIDVATGGDLISGGTPITATNFAPDTQLQRPALLITHTALGGTNLYVAFGAGAFELDSAYLYNGWVFGYTVTYTGTTPTAVSVSSTPTTFNSTPSTAITNVFPSTSHAPPTTVPPGDSPSCDTPPASGDSCYHGDNWVGVTGISIARNGGIWMAGKGPSSDSHGNVYVAAGNGPFDCLDPNNNQTSCKDVTGTKKVVNFGQSVIELNNAGATTPLAPADFFTPFTYHYLNDADPLLTQQFKVLNRYDLDFGTPGAMLLTTNSNAQTWAVTADKTGYIYVMPTLNSGTGSNGLGQFQSGDSGLTSGTSYVTQAPFQASRQTAAGGTSGVCPVAEAMDSSHFEDTDCDEIMQLAWWNNNLFIWPENETVLGYLGAYLA